MPLDGLAIRALADDLDSSLADARIERIYQPRPLALSIKLFHRRHPGFLFFTFESSKPLIWFSEEGSRDNLFQSGFLQIMRKYVEGSRITSVTQHPGWERILYIDCSPSGNVYLMTAPESASSGPRLVAELMGRNSNLILLDQTGKILGSLRRPPEGGSDVATNRLQPGARYAPPPSEPKIHPEDLDGEILFEAFARLVAPQGTTAGQEPVTPVTQGAISLKDALVHVVAGLGPSTAVRLCAMAGIPASLPIQEILRDDLYLLSKVIREVTKRVERKEVTPTFVFRAAVGVRTAPLQDAERQAVTATSAPGSVGEVRVGLRLDDVPGVQRLLAQGEEIPDFPVVPADFFPFEPTTPIRAEEIVPDTAPTRDKQAKVPLATPTPAQGATPHAVRDLARGEGDEFFLRFTSMKALLYAYGYCTAVLEEAEGFKRSITAYLRSRLLSLENKKKAQLEDLSRAEKALSFRRFGDLLMAHSGRIEAGSHEVVLPHFETGEPVRIPLDPSLSPIANAQNYYAKYRKAKRGIAAIRDQIEKTDIEMAFLEQSLASIKDADYETLKGMEEDLLNLKKGDANGRLTRRRRVPVGLRVSGASTHDDRQERTPKTPWQDIYHFTTKDGYYVYVGRSDRQNEILTFRIARPDDLWLHVKDAPGAHVIIRVPEGVKEGDDPGVPETTLIQAAQAAAFFSKSRFSQNVPVDWTRRRNVYRLKGMPAGKVLYRGHRTIYVDPKEPSCGPQETST
ncbi:MAG TPA: fibronectin/fibrinogen-binding protein [Clostridia bacterium]|nr:fibronectin/fibrinogen-binding protein [Clostridia bacterium]